MRVSACLIVRNEERCLDACLSRLRPFSDEIVVVDTGSTDRSVSIAEKHGARVFHQEWQNDFSRPRNAGLEQATGDWIFYIDADEQAEAFPEHKLVLDDPEAVAATVNLRAARHLSAYAELRLFRNRPDLRFRGAIHETIRPDIMEIVERENATILNTGMRIEHFGYEGDLRHKHLRNHDMLLLAVKNDPGRTYLWHALGECELGLGNEVAAEAAWRSALTLVRTGEQTPTDALIYADLIGLHFAENSHVLGDVQQLLLEAQDNHPNDPLLMWYFARDCLVRGETSAARDILGHLRSWDPDPRINMGLGHDQRLAGEYTFALLGSCAMAEDAFEEAEDFFTKALQLNPNSLEIRCKLTLARAKNKTQDFSLNA